MNLMDVLTAYGMFFGSACLLIGGIEWITKGTGLEDRIDG